MSDGDVVHANLPARFWGAYRQLCGPEFNPEATAHDVALPLKKSFNRQASAITNLIEAGVAILEHLPKEPLLKQIIDFGQVSRQIDKLVQQYPLDHKTMELAKNTLKDQLDNFRYDNAAFDVLAGVQGCFMHIYDAQFVGRIPLTPDHPNGIDFSTISQRLQEMRCHVETEVSKFARDAVEHKEMRRRTLKKQLGDLYAPGY